MIKLSGGDGASEKPSIPRVLGVLKDEMAMSGSHGWKASRRCSDQPNTEKRTYDETIQPQ
jgi:hypothetical protein